MTIQDRPLHFALFQSLKKVTSRTLAEVDSMALQIA